MKMHRMAVLVTQTPETAGWPLLRSLADLARRMSTEANLDRLVNRLT
jgi:hypothetical protein